MTKGVRQDTGDREAIQLWVDDKGHPGQVKRDDAHVTWPAQPIHLVFLVVIVVPLHKSRNRKTGRHTSTVS